MNRDFKKNAGVTPGRNFLKTSVAASLAAALPLRIPAAAAGSDTIRVGVIGCGGRGTGAAIDCLTQHQRRRGGRLGRPVPRPVGKLACRNCAALSQTGSGRPRNLFHRFRRFFQGPERSGDQPGDSGHPPSFPPRSPEGRRRRRQARLHGEARRRGPGRGPLGHRHRRLAADKGLAIVAGTQRRHQSRYLEMMRRIHDGAIGEIVGGECYWNQGELWVKRRSRRCPTWNGSAATGCTSPGFRATTSSNSTCTTST